MSKHRRAKRPLIARWWDELLPAPVCSLEAARDTLSVSLYGSDSPEFGSPACAPGHALPATVSAVLRHGARAFGAVSNLEEAASRLGDAVASDMAITESTGRWPLGTPDPETFVAGDAVCLRSIIVSSLWAQAVMALRSGARTNAAAQVCLGGALQWAQPYFLPAEVVDAVVDATPPAEELSLAIRLRSPVTVVWFGKEVPLPTADAVNDPSLSEYLEKASRSLAAASWLPISPYGRDAVSIEQAAVERDGRLTGMVLFSDDSGRLNDEMLWIVSAGPNVTLEYPANQDRTRGMASGLASQSLLGGLARIVAATVAWGRWGTPAVPLDIDRDDRSIRRAARTGAWRRREPHGALAGVHVIDVAETVPRAAGAAGRANAEEMERMSPVPHWRRPHVRRVRVGPRSEWHYEEREVGRSFVMPHGPVRSGELVWRIPETHIGHNGLSASVAPPLRLAE